MHSEPTSLEWLRNKFFHTCLFFGECRADDLIKVGGEDWKLLLDGDPALKLKGPAFVFYPDGAKNNPKNDLQYAKIIPCCCKYQHVSNNSACPLSVCQIYVLKIPDSRSTLRLLRHVAKGANKTESFSHANCGKEHH